MQSSHKFHAKYDIVKAASQAAAKQTFGERNKDHDTWDHDIVKAVSQAAAKQAFGERNKDHDTQDHDIVQRRHISSDSDRTIEVHSQFVA